MSRLAIDGGASVCMAMLPYGRHRVDEDEVVAVATVLRSNWLTTGPTVAEFEEALASYVGTRIAVALSTGTVALHAAAFLFIGPGDEAVVSPITLVDSANCFLYQQVHALFADIQPELLNIEPAEIAKPIGERAKALIRAGYSGQPVDLHETKRIAEAFD